MRPLIVLAAAAITAGAQQQFPIHKLSATGQSRLPEAAVVQSSGLKPHQAAVPADFGKACDRIISSGFFLTCNFRYEPVTVNGVNGFGLQFIVTETGGLTPARIEIPGLAEDAVWSDLSRQDPRVQRRIPGNDDAANHYIAAIEAYLAARGTPRKIVAQMEGGMGRPMEQVFQPADMPHVADVSFAGNHAIAAEVLRKSTLSVASQFDYTERRFAEVLERNLRPPYEELGRLRVQFTPHATVDHNEARITVDVDEGPVYTLSAVTIAGEGVDEAALRARCQFPLNRTANWRLVEAALTRLEKQFKSEGYLSPRVEQKRSLEADNTVRLALTVNRGRQSFFDRLVLVGLDANLEKVARKAWTLAAGAPMNDPYIDDYLRALMKDSRFGAVRGLSRSMRPDPARPTSMVVTLEFR